jgi:ABC-type uncharacterized transport system auxiliary subunit
VSRPTHVDRACLALILLILAASWGCSQLLGSRAEIRDRRKFIIEAEPAQLNLPNSERPYQLRVQIDRFSVSSLYNRDQIIFRLTPEEIDDDRYNLWAVRPADMITSAVADYLRRAGLFTDVREDFLNSSPDLTLTGTINSIERYDSGDRWFGRLNITMQLVDRQNQIFWQHQFNPDEIEVYDSDMVFTVQALRELLRLNMERAISSLDRALLYRKATLEGRDLTGLLEGYDTSVEESQEDTAEIPLETLDYQIMPGKLAPQD